MMYAIASLIAFVIASAFWYDLVRDLRNILAVRNLRPSEYAVYCAAVLFWVVIIFLSLYWTFSFSSVSCQSLRSMV